MQPYRIIIDVKNTSHPHAAAAFLNDFAYKQAKTIASKYKYVIDIGGSPFRTPNNHHMCVQINDARTDARYRNAAWCKLGVLNNDKFDFSRYLSGQHNFCVNGAQFCTYKADYAYAVNVYDITMEQIAMMFIKHELQTLDMFMFLPYCLISHLIREDQKIYTCKYNKSKTGNKSLDTLDFYLNDQSLVYTHNYQVWQSYYTTTKIQCANFSILVEHKQTWGTFTQIRFSRSTFTNGVPKICIPLSKLCKNVVVPDLVYYFQERQTGTSIFSKCICVDRIFINRITAWCDQAKDDMFNYTSFSTYVNSTKNTIRYSQNSAVEMVYQGVDLDDEMLRRLQLSLFVIAAIRRFKRSQFISGAFKFLANNQPDMEILSLPATFKNTWLQLKQNVRNAMLNAFKTTDQDHSADVLTLSNHIDQICTPNFIYNARIVVYDDVFYDGVVNLDLYHNFRPTAIVFNPSASPPIMPSTNHHENNEKTDVSVEYRKDDIVEIVDRVKCALKLAYNPPGQDGLCGPNAIKYFVESLGMQYNDKYDKPWCNADELNTICINNNVNLIVHVNENCETVFDNEEQNTAKVNLCDNHWTLVNCTCAVTKHLSCAYEQLNIDPNYLYICNSNAGYVDSFGQPSSFAKMFPKYKDYIKNFTGLDFVKYQYDDIIIHLCIVMPPKYDKNDPKSHKNVHSQYEHIFDNISEYALKHQLIVYMPALGLGAFNCNLSCFKACLIKLKCSYVHVHNNIKGQQFFEQTLPCNIGGYTPINRPWLKVKLIKGQYHDRIYNAFSGYTPTNHMLTKIADIFDFLKDQSISFSRVVDLAVAPGAFIEYYELHKINTLLCDYQGPNALPLYPQYKDRQFKKYKNINKLTTELHLNEDDVLLFDYFIDHNNYTALLNAAQKVSALITKFKHDPDHFDLMNLVVNFANNTKLQYTFLNNDGSSTKSSEIYVVFVKDEQQDYVEPSDCDYHEQALLNDRINTKKFLKAPMCDHDLESVFKEKTNTTITINYDNIMTDNYVALFNDREKTKIKISPYKQYILNVYNGVAGASKTACICKNACGKCTLLITPFRLVADQYKDISCTYILAIERVKNMSIKYIIFDEVFALSPHYIALIMQLSPNSKFFALGDDKQITDRDYDNNSPNIKIDVNNYECETKRMPQVVVDKLVKYIPNLKTTSKVKGIFAHNYDVDCLYNLPPGDKSIILTGTQNMKEELIKKCSQEVNTINGAQGITRKEVHWYIGDLYMLPQDKIRYVYVAMSRATHKLVTYGTVEQHEQLFTILDTPVETALEDHNVSLVDEVVYQQIAEPVKKHTQIVTVDPSIVSQSAVEDILDKVYIPANDQTTAVIDYKSDVILENSSHAKFKTHIEAVSMDVTKIYGRRFGRRNYQKYYHGKNKKQTVDCILSRYAKEGKRIDSKYIKEYIKGFNKFMRDDWIKFATKELKSERGRQEMRLSVMDYLIELQKKYPKDDVMGLLDLTDEQKGNLKFDIRKLIEAVLTGKKNKFTELQKDWYDSYHQLVDFHLKRQPKEVREAGYDARFKAGQGVSAWSKLLNIIFSSMTRTYARFITKYLKPNVQLAYGKADVLIAEDFKKYSDYINSKNYQKLTCDFSEFDSSQEKQGILSSCMILKMMGFDGDLVNFYMAKRKDWTLINQDENFNMPLRTMLDGEYMQHSGQPFTLDGNTMFNMSCMGMCFEFVNMIFASFKGDDSYILAESIKPIMVGHDTLYAILSYKLKYDFQNISEYIANIITPTGFFPDVLRRTSRILTKIYTVADDWEEIKKSTADALDVIADDQELYEGAIIASEFYKQQRIDLTPTDVVTLVTFLRQICKNQTLDDVALRTWIILPITKIDTIKN
ncbi:hypothetical protein 1 [Forsythia suspensa hepe-like virus]|nr:hypothetical protein 1 [Forsythia suspensa hepe-like virus]